MGIIISGFPGIGKTTLQKHYLNVIDLESSDFKWIYPKEVDITNKEAHKGTANRTQNPKWPLNYVRTITQKTNEYDIILISQDKDLRDYLRANGHDFIVCFPTKSCKNEYIRRYIQRGNNEAFISLVQNNFEDWIDALMQEDNKIIMEPGEFLEDTLIRYHYL